LKCRGKNQKG